MRKNSYEKNLPLYMASLRQATEICNDPSKFEALRERLSKRGDTGKPLIVARLAKEIMEEKLKEL